MSRRGPIHTVFVGNLAYEVTEEQLHEAFQRVGPVLAVRIRRDNDGRSRGIGFVEYADAEIAQSAVRNLQGLELGNRAIRLDYNSNNTSASNGAGGGGGDAGGDLLGGMSMKELFEIMAEMKKLVAQNPEQARQILTQQPAMTRALFHAQMKLGMVQGQVQGGGGGGGDGFPGSGAGGAPPPMAQGGGAMGGGGFGGSHGGPPPGMPPQFMQGGPGPGGPGFHPGGMGGPPPQHPHGVRGMGGGGYGMGGPPPGYGGPPPGPPMGMQGGYGGNTQQQQHQSPMDGVDPSQQHALLQQVLAMTPEQMDRLTPVQRTQVEQLRAAAMSQGRM